MPRSGRSESCSCRSTETMLAAWRANISVPAISGARLATAASARAYC